MTLPEKSPAQTMAMPAINSGGTGRCSCRHLSRTLSSFAERGLLKKEGRGIVALDPRQLRRLAGDVPEEGTINF
jgi:hypothetical protein